MSLNSSKTYEDLQPIEGSWTKAGRAILDSIGDRSLSLEERGNLSIKLAACLLHQSKKEETLKTKSERKELARMMQDPKGKAFLTAMTDQCFRSSSSKRSAEQLIYILRQRGVPRFLSLIQRIGLKMIKQFGRFAPSIVTPAVTAFVRRRTANVIMPGEENELLQHIQKRHKEGVLINLNHLGEAILGEEESKARLNLYLDDLKHPLIEYISIKISTIYSQIHLLASDATLEKLSERLRELYRAAIDHPIKRPDGSFSPKFINLDMEEYRDLYLTVDLFQKVLDEPEFLHLSAGIVLQSYLPDSFDIQVRLTEWAMERIKKGGAPIKIRIVKGANLAMEQVEASLKDWPQAPYLHKADVDANYKKMVTYGMEPEHAQACHLGVASHNLFDISYALILRKEKHLNQEITFEMLEGMADPMRRAVQALSGEILLYCPAAKKDEFQNAVAYLIRRLDENTAPDNFLRHSFGLKVGSKEWQEQASMFLNALNHSQTVNVASRRQQNRYGKGSLIRSKTFSNEPDTDWSLPTNQKWAHEIKSLWMHRNHEEIPLVIDGIRLFEGDKEQGLDPSHPNHSAYTFTKLRLNQIDRLLEGATVAESRWARTSFEERSRICMQVADALREKRGDLLGSMLQDVAKPLMEGDPEVSEAIDFAEYYSRSAVDFSKFEDIAWGNKGIVLVASPWNFPCSIPAGGILAALMAGNSVIFKPAKESILVGWHLASLFWEAGVPQDVLSFVACDDDTVGSALIKDPRIHSVILTGSTQTARKLLHLRPGLDLSAETGGKNSIIVTDLSDRDLAVKDIVQSAFGFSGQKCSACSLLILEKEVYLDPKFKKQLKDAVSSLSVGSAWQFKNKVNPLIKPPEGALLQSIKDLEEGEEWLVEPRLDPQNPQILSPGIKWGVKEGSFTHQNELFGPVLAVMCAEDLDHAIRIANGTPYGLTAGLHSLDEREKKHWFSKIKAGNCYINRTITGAIVQRQPFGGCKDSHFGRGAKAGGPNYITQLMEARQVGIPKELSDIPAKLAPILTLLESLSFSEENRKTIKTTLESAVFHYDTYFSKAHDPSLLLGQDNFLSYVPHHRVVLRFGPHDSPVAFWQEMATVAVAGTLVEVSYDPEVVSWISKHIPGRFDWFEESDAEFINRMRKGSSQRVRLLSPMTDEIKQVMAETFCFADDAPVLMNGRLEHLHFLREVSLSADYHRYGNLSLREGEARKGPNEELPS